MVVHSLKSLLLSSHRSSKVLSLALASSLALFVDKLKLEPIKLVDYYILVVRTSAALKGGVSLISLTSFFQARIIQFHTCKPLVADGRWTMSHATNGNQYSDFGCGFMELIRCLRKVLDPDKPGSMAKSILVDNKENCNQSKNDW